MERVANWESKLNKAIVEMRSKTFEYGVADCALMVCDVVKAITGVDPGDNVRETYDETTAPNLEETAERIAIDLNIEEVEPSRARRGDVVLMNVKGHDVLGVVDMTGSKAVFPLVGGGVARWPALKSRRAWRI